MRLTAALRMFQCGATLTGSVLVAACGSGPDAPSPAEFQTTVRVVSALSSQVGLPDVVVSVAGAREERTDASGALVIATASPTTVPMRLSHPAFVEREATVRVPGDRTVELSLIPSSLDLAAFEEFAPRIAGLQRWTRNPRLLLLDHAVDFSGATLGFREFPVLDRPVATRQLECLSTGIGASLAEFSGGHLAWTAIEIGRVEPGTRFRTDQTPEGTIVVLMSTALGGATGRGTGYVGAEPFVLTRGAIWLLADTIDFCLTSLLYRHELGHALGYQHVTRAVSMMSPAGLPSGLTEFDRNSISIVFQRRPGNRSPDRDPDGVLLNVSSPATRESRLPIW